MKALPSWAEILLVVLVAFGDLIYASAYYAMNPGALPPSSAGGFAYLAVSEIIKAILIVGFLRARGWIPAEFGIAQFSWRDLRHGAALLVVILLLGWIAYYAARLFRADLEPAAIQVDEDGLPIALSVALSIINSSFEELFVCAYIIAAWRSDDVWTAIALSSMLRLSYHLYQGPVAIVMIFPLGVLFAWYFANQRRLLPLIIAHAALDLFALLQAS